MCDLDTPPDPDGIGLGRQLSQMNQHALGRGRI